MAPARRSSVAVEEREPMVAVVIPDDYNNRLSPLTLETPSSLLRVAGIPVIDYTMEWLSMSGVEEVLVLCTPHEHGLRAHLEASAWSSSRGGMHVRALPVPACLSPGDALRALDAADVVSGDFVLVVGAGVRVLDLTGAWEAHAARRRSDKGAVMTMVLRAGMSGAQARRLGVEPCTLALDPFTGRLLKAVPGDDSGAWSLNPAGEEDEDEADGGPAAPTSPSRNPAKPPLRASASTLSQAEPSRRVVGFPSRTPLSLDAHLFGERDAVVLRSDALDVGVFVCAPQTLLLFSDNFDYQEVSRDFVSGMLSEEELGSTIYTHLDARGYAARVHSLRALDAVTRDVLGRWTFPLVPEGAWASPRGAASLGGPTGAAAPAGSNAVSPTASGALSSHSSGLRAENSEGRGGGGAGGAGANPPTTRVGFGPVAGHGALAGAGSGHEGARGSLARASLAPGLPPAPPRPLSVAPPPPGHPLARLLSPGTSFSPQSLVYVHATAALARSAALGPCVCVGPGCVLEEEASAEHSVLGPGVKMGAGSAALGSILGDGVRLGRRARVVRAVLGDGVVLGEGAIVSAGAVLGPGVVVEAGATVPAGACLALVPPPVAGNSDDEELGSGWSAAAAGRDGRAEGEPAPEVRRAAAAAATGGLFEPGLGFDAQLVGTLGVGFAWPCRRGDDALCRDGAAARRLLELERRQLWEESEDEVAGEGRPGALRSQLSGASAAAAGGERDDQRMQTASAAVFRMEVAETMLRCETEGVAQENALIELNALKIAEDRTFADCARYMLATALGLAADKVFEGRTRPAEAPRGDRVALLRRAVEEIGVWRALLHKFLKSEDDQVELLLTLEEFAGEEGEFESERGGVFAELFAQVLKALYDADIVSEEAVQKWAEEKVHAEEDERVFLNKAKPFLDWLAAAEEESEEDGDESD